MIKSFVNCILLSAFLTLISPQAGRADALDLSENEVKTSYLYNFIKYVEWPHATLPRENTYLTLCIVGKSPLNEVIESLSGKIIKNRKLVVKLFSRVEDLNECNILFINNSAKTSLHQILAAIASRPILTVSDCKGFAAAGGVIEFVPVKDKLRFEINNRAAQHVNLHISSHLLRLAATLID